MKYFSDREGAAVLLVEQWSLQIQREALAKGLLHNTKDIAVALSLLVSFLDTVLGEEWRNGDRGHDPYRMKIYRDVAQEMGRDILEKVKGGV